MKEAGQSDQVHTERLHEQDAGRATQAETDDEASGDELGRGGALQRLAEQATRRDSSEVSSPEE